MYPQGLKTYREFAFFDFSVTNERFGGVARTPSHNNKKANRARKRRDRANARGECLEQLDEYDNGDLVDAMIREENDRYDDRMEFEADFALFDELEERNLELHRKHQEYRLKVFEVDLQREHVSFLIQNYRIFEEELKESYVNILWNRKQRDDDLEELDRCFDAFRWPDEYDEFCEVVNPLPKPFLEDFLERFDPLLPTFLEWLNRKS